jgi:hypothetical protein
LRIIIDSHSYNGAMLFCEALLGVAFHSGDDQTRVLV